MRKLAFGWKLAAAGLLLTLVTTVATALVALLSDSDCLRGAVLHRVLPSPAFRISADRRVLEFDGPITFGVAATLERLLAAYGTIKVLHLTSNGGRVTEASRMAALVKGRNLDTYVSAGCASACTDVFFAGRERLIGPSAWLGFHQGRVSGHSRDVTEEAQQVLVAMQVAELRRFGVSEDFAKRAVEARGDEVWRPSQAELLAARVATGVVDSSALSASPPFCQHALRTVDLHVTLGRWALELGGADGAIRSLDRAIRKEPDHSGALMYRAMAYADKREHGRAIEEFGKVIRLDPKSYGAFLARGLSFVKTGDYDRAIRDFDQALRLAPNEAIVFAYRGATYGGKGEYDRAIAEYTKAIELAPIASFYNGRAWAYFKAGRAAEGLADAERALQLSPGLANALDTRGHIFEALGRREEAIADFRRALAIDPSIQASKDALKRLGATAEGEAEGRRPVIGTSAQALVPFSPTRSE